MEQHVFEGEGPPLFTPTASLQHYIDKTTGNIWISRGVVGVHSWGMALLDQNYTPSYPAPTKESVGLGKVENYAPATSTEASEGSSNTTYMTPGLTTTLISAMLATTTEALAGNNNTKLMTPATAKVLVDQLLVLSLVDDKWKTVVSETLTIATAGYKEYDLQTLLGSDHAGYDKPGARVNIRVKDPDTTSATYNMMVDGVAVTTTAIDGSRYVRVYNHFSESLEFHISIAVRKL